MRIITRLRITAAVTTAASFLMMPMFIWAFHEFNDAKSDYLLTSLIQEKFHERAAFRDQYFLYREDRARALWDSNKKESDDLLRQAKAQFQHQEDRLLLEHLQAAIEDTALLFHRVVGNSEMLEKATNNRSVYEELDKRLYSQLLLKATIVRDTAAALKDTNAQRIEQAYRRLAVVLSLFGLILALAAIKTSLQISRLIHRRLIPLHQGAKSVANGDLNHRIAFTGADEFTELARSINAMTGSLQAFTMKLRIEIMQRKQAQEDLQQSEARFRKMFESNDAVMLLIKPDAGDIMDANMAAIRFYGYPLEHLKTMKISQINMLPPDEIMEELQRAKCRQRNFFIFPHRLANGDIRTVEVRSSPIEIGHDVVVFSIISDITDRKKMEDQIRQMAFYDPLTQLPNRRLLTDRLTQTMATNARSGNYGAMLFLDLDNFKSLNDTHGHECGDLLLIESANRLKNCVREMDTVARFGGDEFVVMLSALETSKAASTAQAGRIAEKIRIALSQPYVLAVKNENGVETTIEHRCTASIGVALFFDHEASQDNILKWADSAMYQAKDSGRNTVRFYAI